MSGPTVERPMPPIGVFHLPRLAQTGRVLASRRQVLTMYFPRLLVGRPSEPWFNKSDRRYAMWTWCYRCG